MIFFLTLYLKLKKIYQQKVYISSLCEKLDQVKIKLYKYTINLISKLNVVCSSWWTLDTKYIQTKDQGIFCLYLCLIL